MRARQAPLPTAVRAYLAAQTVSIVGVGAQNVVLPLVVVTRYGAPWALGAVAAARAAGLLAVWPAAGWIVDRFGALRAAAVTHLLFAAVTAAMAGVYAAELSVWWFVALSAVLGAVMAVDTPARRGGVTDLVGADEAGRVLTLSMSATWAGRLVGAAVGAGVWAAAPVAAFVVNAVGFLGPAAVFARSRGMSPARRGGRPQPVAALGRLREKPTLAKVVVATVIAGCAVDFGVSVPLVALRFGEGVHVAAAEAALAVGAVTAGLTAARRVTASAGSASVGWCAAAAGFALTAAPAFPAVLAGFALAGGGVSVAGALSNALAATGAPDGTRSDLLAGMGVAQWATSLAAGPLVVAASAVAGAPGVAAVGAVGTAAAAVVTLTARTARTLAAA